MACKVGSANADIAGLGIIISFAFQAGLSILLSVCSLLLWPSAVSFLDLFKLFIFSDDPKELARIQTTNPRVREVKRIILTFFIDELDKYRPDSSFKDTFETLLAVLDQPQLQGNTALDHLPSSVAKQMWRRGERNAMKKKCIDDILVAITDVQIISAMGLLIAALVQHENLSLYHLHVVYDTASFTGISICASLINVSADTHHLKQTRIFAIAAYICIFLSFSVVFGIKLNRWDENVAGHCYNTRLIAFYVDPHPLSDMVYLGVTCFYSICALLSCYGSGSVIPILARSLKRLFPWRPIRYFLRKPDASLRLKVAYLLAIGILSYIGIVYLGGYLALLAHPRPEYRVWALIPLAMGQYPLHLYMAIAIRKGNEKLLEGDSENDWGFGQIVALVLCAATCIECIRGLSKYRKAVEAGSIQPQGTRARRWSV
ncbi:hypothetical protein CEP53_013795 [Fusarium sp. AF-6]|nr:hypothetical protein CEP53_013795 [Fusarium sp. AF-6]